MVELEDLYRITSVMDKKSAWSVGHFDAGALQKRGLTSEKAEYDKPKSPTGMEHDAAEINDVQETADYLRVHPTTIGRLVKQRQIPAFRIGNGWRFSIEAIDRWQSEQEAGQRPG